MQLGFREVFTYMECSNCGCLQLLDIPADLGRYYPNDGYYSFHHPLKQQRPGVLQRIKSSYLLHGKNVLPGRLLSIGYKVPDYYSWVKIPGIKNNEAILDVGSGNGSLLISLARIGFSNLTGIDPFIKTDLKVGTINIYKKNIFEVEGQFDYIMLHHAFEHMEDPLRVLQQLFKLVRGKGYVLIRTPLMDNYSWKKYGINWMDIDAPRHIIIHTLKSLQILASQAGFELRKIVYDGNYMSLIGSDQYAKDIALPDWNSYMKNKKASGYSKKNIRQFKKITEQNNLIKQADQAAFYLYKP
jgi:2-polyprenyl-3-methyl-5-hydroxy-6-metoxy-1,4-benzoquinol methylase